MNYATTHAACSGRRQEAREAAARGSRTVGIDPKRAFTVGVINGREARESGLHLNRIGYTPDGSRAMLTPVA
jgi:hypothetical protein